MVYVNGGVRVSVAEEAGCVVPTERLCVCVRASCVLIFFLFLKRDKYMGVREGERDV